VASGDSDDGIDGEEQAVHGETDDERAERTERNRQRRAESKQKRKDYIESLKRELSARDRIINDLNQRVSVVERRSSGSEMAQLEKAESDAAAAYNHFKQVNQKAIEQADGETAVKAQEAMMAARDRYNQIKNIRAGYAKQQAAPQPLDPRLANHAQEWMSKNEWYDPNGKDVDSDIALTIDRRLASEGWDPTTPEYWEELDKRVKKHLPHRDKRGIIESSGRRNNPPPVAGSGRQSSSSNNAGTYKLSSERVQALKEAGLWDDPKQRADAIRRFQQYDKEQRV
jgi:hypothetical protein